MAFDEVRLPDDVERGAVGGPEWNTTVLELTSGFEKRNANWSAQRGQWDVGYGIRNRADFTSVIAFFYARQGRARGFRFKDWSDFTITQDVDGNLGTGNGSQTVFQARKQYVSGSVTYNRTVKKLVSGTVQVYLDDALQASGFTIDLNAGTVTFDTPPGGGVVVSITAEFDVPVRFDTDKLDINMQAFDAGSVPSFLIKEVRLA